MELLRNGSRGDVVTKVQQRLAKIYKGVGVNGIYGDDTQATVEKFQEEKGLDVDGIVGPISWNALFGEEPPEQEIVWPLMQDDVEGIMGDPHDPAFKANWLVFIDLSKYVDTRQIPKNGLEVQDGKHGFWGNKLLEKPFIAALENVIAAGATSDWHVFSGCSCVRNKKGRSHLSQHSWGMAVDINADENPFNSNRRQLSVTFINCFAKAGFEPGAYWASPKDNMHFQVARTRQNWPARLAELGYTQFVPPAIPPGFQNA